MELQGNPRGNVTIAIIAAAAGLALLAWPAIWQSWPWWLPAVGALSCAGVAFAGAAIRDVCGARVQGGTLAAEEEGDLHFDQGQSGESPEEAPVFVLDPLPPPPVIVLSPEERRDLPTFLRWLHCVGTEYQKWPAGMLLPSGRILTPDLWAQYAGLLVRLRVVSRKPIAGAPLVLKPHKEALLALRPFL